MAAEFSLGLAILIAYYAVFVSLGLLIRALVPMHPELFRKILHLIMLFSLLILIYAFDTWWLAVLCALAFIALVFPILALLARIKGFSQAMVERKKHELCGSLILAFSMFAIMITVCWGLLGERLLALACIYAWGFGDAAAALVGKRFGKHPLQGRMIEGRKSVEGTLAMFVVSFISVFTILLIRGGLDWLSCLIISAAAAAASAAVELYTKNGADTITCPLAAGAVILPLLYAWGSISL